LSSLPFSTALSIGESAQHQVGKWLATQGYQIIEITGDRAPIVLGDDGIKKAPDLHVIRAGLTEFGEVKAKKKLTFYRRDQRNTTGFGLCSWNNYLEVQEATGLIINVIFVHQEENIVTWDSLDALKLKFSHKYTGKNAVNRGGDIFFRFDDLNVIAKASDVLKKDPWKGVDQCARDRRDVDRFMRKVVKKHSKSVILSKRSTGQRSLF
jgi:hypothetical protein